MSDMCTDNHMKSFSSFDDKKDYFNECNMKKEKNIMSDYLRQKVLRIPVSIDDKIFDKTDRDDLDMEYYYPELFSYSESGKFQLAPTEDLFIDYVLESEYGCNCGDYGKTRSLYQSEKEKYQEIFNQIIPNCDMNKVRFVEYCWYNCSEAPSYYNEINDDFYKEI